MWVQSSFSSANQPSNHCTDLDVEIMDADKTVALSVGVKERPGFTLDTVSGERVEVEDTLSDKEEEYFQNNSGRDFEGDDESYWYEPPLNMNDVHNAVVNEESLQNTGGDEESIGESSGCEESVESEEFIDELSALMEKSLLGNQLEKVVNVGDLLSV